jgi:hypothetical protein
MCKAVFVTSEILGFLFGMLPQASGMSLQKGNGCLIVEFWETIFFFFSWPAMSHHCSWLLNVQGCFCMLAIVRWCLQMFHEFNKLVDKNAFSQLCSSVIWGLLAWSEEVFWFVSRFAGMVVLLDRSICLWIVIWTTKHTGIKKVWSQNLIL